MKPRLDHPSQKGTLVVAAVLGVAVFGVYSNAFTGPFLFDDVAVIRDNPAIGHFWGWGSTAGQGLTSAGRPLVAASLALNHAISGTGTLSYHLFNVLIHWAAAVTLFALVKRTLQGGGEPAAWKSCPTSSDGSTQGRGKPATWPSWSTSSDGSSSGAPHGASGSAVSRATLFALTVALLWALHPLCTEAVTYTVQRAESMMALFYLLTLYGFARATESNGRPGKGWRALPLSPETLAKGSPTRLGRWQVLCWTACLLGMASKEVMVSAPLIVFLYDRTFVSGSFAGAWRRHRGLHLALASTWLLLIWEVAATGNRGATAGFGAGVVWWRYALMQFPAIVHYLHLAFWPYPLVFYYGAALPLRALPVLLSAGLILSVLAAAIASFKKRPVLAFLALAFFAVLAPSSSVVPVATEVMAEHRMYLPLAALLTAAALAVAALPATRLVKGALALAAILSLGAVTHERNRVYRSARAIWEDTVLHFPEGPEGQYNLGLVLFDEGDFSSARVRFAEATRLKPDYAQAHNNLGRTEEALGQNREAIDEYQRAVALRPDLVEAQNNLGNCLLHAGDLLGAIEHYRSALAWEPRRATTHSNLGLALSLAERPDEAMVELDRAQTLDPSLPEVPYNLGNLYVQMGKNAQAARCYEAALRLKPNWADAHHNLDVVTGRLHGDLSSP